jgi:hypothetical protein
VKNFFTNRITGTIAKSTLMVGRDSSVGIATRYRPDDSGIESRWLRDLPHPFRQALGPIQPLIHSLTTYPPSGAEVKEIVELYLYSHSGPSWYVLG